MLVLTGGLFVELPVPADVISEVSSAKQVHDQIQIFSVLEGVVHIDQERTIEER